MITVGVSQENDRVRQVVMEDLTGDQPDIKITGQARTGSEALELMPKREPDVLVTDLALPELSALELITRLTVENRSTRVIVCSAYYSDTYIVEAFQRGASGYVLKALAGSRLINAVRAVESGERVFYNDYIDCSLEEYLVAEREKRGLLFETLTDREREVLFLIAQGLDRAALAHRLGISIRTVDKHDENLYAKLEVDGRSELMALGFKKGYVPLPYVAPELKH